MNFWSCRKEGLIRKISLPSKFRTSQLVNKQLQYTYCPISYEVKKPMKPGQLIVERKIFFFKIYAENEAGYTSSRPLFYFSKKPNMK